jgi:3-keto-5-aminohexanoate cleavage enzyme
MSLGEKLIINAAITGMVPTKCDNPHVPISAEEIAQDARRCRDAGASIVHIHARDEAGKPAWQKEIHRQILQRVRELCPDIILCVSTSGRVFRQFEQRSAVLELDDPKPEMASLTLGSMNFSREESVNNPEMIKALALRMAERGVMPELEVFELGMAEHVHYLVRENILKAPHYCNILLGSLGTLGANAFNLAVMVRALPAGTTWAAAGIGRFQFQVNSLAVVMGGHVRVGLEDNIWFDRERRELASNPMLIERITTLSRACGRDIATPAEAREIVGLSQPTRPARSPS